MNASLEDLLYALATRDVKFRDSGAIPFNPVQVCQSTIIFLYRSDLSRILKVSYIITPKATMRTANRICEFKPRLQFG